MFLEEGGREGGLDWEKRDTQTEERKKAGRTGEGEKRGRERESSSNNLFLPLTFLI